MSRPSLISERCIIDLGNRRLLYSLLFIFTAQALLAATPAVIETQDLVVVYSKELDKAAQQIRVDYPTVKKELEDLLRWSLNLRPTVVLIKERKEFLRLAGNELVVAFAVPEKHLVVIDYSKMHTSPFTLPATLKHELCHLLLHDHIPGANLPRWWDEGICQWASDGLADIIINTKPTLLPAAILAGGDFDLRTLNDHFPQNNKALILAYEQSRSVVDYISREYGSNGVLDLLGNLKQGDSIESALEKTLFISFDELQKQWRHHLRRRITWFTYLSIHLYEILFLSAALLTILGFVRKMIQRRAYSAQEDEEDVS
jgi:hypothetical protein